MDLFTQWTALAALAVVVIQQILKLNVVPVFFANKYPVLTNALLSVIASVAVEWGTLTTIHGVLNWVAEVGVISIVAAIAYNATLHNSELAQRLTKPQ